MASRIILLALSFLLLGIDAKREFLSPYARSLHRRKEPKSLHRRQEEITVDGETILDCLPSCEYTGSGVDTPARKRSLDEYGLLDLATGSNVTQLEDLETSDVTHEQFKRQWKITSGDTLILQQPPYTIGQLSAYLYNQVSSGGTYDNQYGDMYGWFQTDEEAVSNEHAFGNQAFQYGTAGIHGCQMIFVIGPNYMWSAHFWESYTNGSPNIDTTSTRSASWTAFSERMLDFLGGVTVNAATASPGIFTLPYPENSPTGRPPTTNHPYLNPAGNPLNNANFPAGGAGVQVFYATPAADNARSNAKSPSLKYPSRVNKVEAALRAYLGDGITITRYPYFRLNGNQASSATEPRGQYLFQYDPNSDGNGQRAWRLFMDGNYYEANV